MDVVAVDALVKRYHEVLALDHFSVHIAQGEVFGLLGPNGSGKSTAINCMLQLLTFEAGTIRLFGETMAPDRYDLKSRIGVIPQQVAVFAQLSVAENIDFFCSLYVKDAAQRKALVAEAIDFVGLGEYTKFRPRKLSGGLLRRLNIACGIAHQPELIFMDEPTVAVDPQSRNAILEGILRLNAAGSTILYTSHYMEEVEQICSRIMIMDRGKEIATGTSSELKALTEVGERIVVELTNPDTQVLEQLRKLPHVASASLDGNALTVTCTQGVNNLIEVIHVLDVTDLSYGRVYSEPPTLNDVFLEITGKELRD